jgi:hypothetical protein
VQFCGSEQTDSCPTPSNPFSTNYSDGPWSRFDDSGFKIPLLPGNYRAHVYTNDGVDIDIMPISIIAGQLINLSFSNTNFILSGKVFIDYNKDGIQNDGEIGYTGEAIIMLSNGKTATTSTDGSYAINDVKQGTYDVSIILPSGYINTTPNPVTNIPITSNTSNIDFGITNSHDKPVTTALLFPEEINGTYTDPTTVTLSATASAGFEIANTYYTIDEGSQQTYTQPFTVTGAGEHTLTYYSVDNSGVQEAPKSSTFTIQSNHSPILDPIGNKTVNEGQTLQFTVSAIDPDGDSLLYSAANLPTGANFNPFTRVFTWTPDFTQEGNYENVEFTVIDDGSPMELDTELITITVGNVNRAPVFEPIGSQEILEGHELSFSVHATDPDGDTVTLSAENLPEGASFDPETGNFIWTPTLSQSGNYVVTFTVTDDGTPSRTVTMDVTISVIDDPTPLEQITILIDTVDNYHLPKKVDAVYSAILKNVQSFIKRDQLMPARLLLNLFIHHVNNNYKHNDISQEVHDHLVSLAQALLKDIQ